MDKIKAVLGILLVFLLTGCSEKYEYSDADVQIGEAAVSVDVVKEQNELMTGMMYRKSLGNSQGMFFVFADDQPKTFWMKNTLIPLDMIFINADFEIVKIHEAEPCEADPCATYSSESPARYVLEVNKGFSEKNGISEGDKIIFKLNV